MDSHRKPLQDRHSHQEREERVRKRRRRQASNNERPREREPQAHPKRAQPRPERSAFSVVAPVRGKVRAYDLTWKVDQDSKRQVLPPEPFLDEFQGGDGFVGLEANLGDEMQDD